MAKKREQRTEQTVPSKGNEVFKHGTPPDVMSTRAKSTAHKKMTADKWNQ